jgi:hypothetical protein
LKEKLNTMGLEEIIEKAREQLPLTSEFENDIIRVLVNNWQIDFDISSQLDAPTEYDKPYHEVEFRKQYVDGIVIGWEFVALVNGV